MRVASYSFCFLMTTLAGALPLHAEAPPLPPVQLPPECSLSGLEPVCVTAVNAKGMRAVLLRGLPAADCPGFALGLLRADGTLLLAHDGELFCAIHAEMGAPASFRWLGEMLFMQWPDVPGEGCLTQLLELVGTEEPRPLAYGKGSLTTFECQLHAGVLTPMELSPQAGADCVALQDAAGGERVQLLPAGEERDDAPDPAAYRELWYAEPDEPALAAARRALEVLPPGAARRLLAASPANGQGERIISCEGEQAYLLSSAGVALPFAGEAASPAGTLPGFVWLADDCYALRASGRTESYLQIRRVNKTARRIEKVLDGLFGGEYHFAPVPGEPRLRLWCCGCLMGAVDARP